MRPPSLQLGDLVSRPPIEVATGALRSHLSSRSVLLTGAGGSIGTELSAQLLALDPHRLLLVDVNEQHLRGLERRLCSNGEMGRVDFFLADVRDEDTLHALLAREDPDIVLHAAAYKHVPLLERHPAAAFRNNTLATVQLLHLCEQMDVEHFAFVSTDKAVQPTSVLGATKRLAEWYVQGGSSVMRRTIVRFGNVYGTRGSVVPRFEDKLAAGDPLPVTHPDMERYFMSVGEACSMILKTLVLDASPTFTFKMGEPVRIQWLAERLIEHWYPSVDPASMIEYVGRRPGEKLSEQLVRPEETVHPTDHPSILGLDGPVPCSREALESHFERLHTYCESPEYTRAQFRERIVHEYPASSLPVEPEENTSYDA